MSPHFLQDSDEGLYWHIKTLARVHRILSLPDNTAVGIDPTVSIRDIQVGAQYTGYSEVLPIVTLNLFLLYLHQDIALESYTRHIAAVC